MCCCQFLKKVPVPPNAAQSYRKSAWTRAGSADRSESFVIWPKCQQANSQVQMPGLIFHSPPSECPRSKCPKGTVGRPKLGAHFTRPVCHRSNRPSLPYYAGPKLFVGTFRLLDLLNGFHVFRVFRPPSFLPSLFIQITFTFPFSADFPITFPLQYSPCISRLMGK